MLINCVAYRDGRKLADIDVEDISRYVGQPDCFVWVALRDASDAELAKMQEEFGLHDLAVEDARHGHQRPKVEEYGDTLFVVLHTVELDAIDRMQVGEVHAFVGPNFVLTVRNRSHQSLLGVRERAEREPHLLRHGAGFVLYALMDAIVDRYFPFIDAMETELEAIEERIFEHFSEDALQDVFALKRDLLAVRRVVAPERDVLNVLIRREVPIFERNTITYLQDVYDHVVRITDSIDTYRDLLSSALDAFLSVQSNRLNQIVKVLTIASIVLMSDALVAGIYGMNFEFMPELHWMFGYPWALGLMACISVGLILFFRSRKWL